MTTTTQSDPPTLWRDKPRYYVTHPIKLVSNRYFVQFIVSAVFVGVGYLALSSEGAGGGTVNIGYRLWSSLTIALMTFVLAAITAAYIIIAKAWGRLFLLFVLVVLIGPLTYWTMFLWGYPVLLKMAQVGVIEAAPFGFFLMGLAALVINALLIFRIGYVGTHGAELAELKRDIDIKDSKLNGAERNADGTYKMIPKLKPDDPDEYVFIGAKAKAELAQTSAAKAQAAYQVIETSHSLAEDAAKKKSDEVAEARAKLARAGETSQQKTAKENLANAVAQLKEAVELRDRLLKAQEAAIAALVAATEDERTARGEEVTAATTALGEANTRITLRENLLKSAEIATTEADTAAMESPDALALNKLETENEALRVAESDQAKELAAANNLVKEKSQNADNEGNALKDAEDDLQKAREAYDAKRKDGRSNRIRWSFLTAGMLVCVPFFYAFGWYAVVLAGATQVVYGNN